MRRALEIDEIAFGADNFRVATDLNSLACLLAATARRDLALPLWQRALVILTKELGADHPDTVGVQERLSANRD